MNDLETRDELAERVSEAVRHALALVGPADSSTDRAAGREGDQRFS